MSWFKTAVHKAVGGNRRNLPRIRNNVDSVVHHAGGKLHYERPMQGGRDVQSYGQTVKKLEELAVTCRGPERISLLRRWLISLKGSKKISRGLIDVKEVDSLTDESLVLYHDSDREGEPVSFHDVFLHSEALEGIILTMILDEPNDEEVALLLEIFRLCLMGGTDVHIALVTSIQDLAKVFSSYRDEVLMKREELLKYAQSAISGLKINAELERIDAEVTSLKGKLIPKDTAIPLGNSDNSSEESVTGTTEALKKSLAQVQRLSKLKALLLEKKAVENGDSPEIHAKKVDKLKILLESLASSTAKAEKRIEDHRHRKEEASTFRIAKVNEVSQVEKDLEAEIGSLQKQKDELEAKLEKVTASLASANKRLHNAREERSQFDVASSEILQHLQTKEEELVRSISSCKKESDVAAAWISFVESTYRLQSKFAKRKEELVDAELSKYAEYFANLALRLLPAYKRELETSLTHFRELVLKMKANDWSDHPSDPLDKGTLASAKSRKKDEEEYLDLEAKFTTTFTLVDSVRQLHAQNRDICRKYDRRIQDLLDELGNLKVDFESTERPKLTGETPRKPKVVENPTSWRTIARKLTFKKSPCKIKTLLEDEPETPVVVARAGQQLLDTDEEQEALESEFLKIIRDNAARELNDWEI